MRNIIIILLLLPFVGQSQTKWRQIERSLTKWNVPAAYDSIPGQAGYAGKWIALTVLLDTLGLDSLGVGGGGIIGTGAANKVAYWKSTDTLSFNNNFHFDNSNTRLGIGLTSPAYSLHTNGAIGTNNDFFLVNPSYSNSGLRIQNYPGSIAGYGVGVIKGTNTSIWSSADDGLLIRNDIKRMVVQNDFQVKGNFSTGKAWLGTSGIGEVDDVIIIDARSTSAEVTAMKYSGSGYPPLNLRGHEINLHTNATPNWPTFSSISSGDIAVTIKGDKKVGLSTTSPTRTLDINGEMRIRDLLTDNPTKLLGADNDGDVSSITLGTGLTVTGTTLSIIPGIDSTIVTDGYGINVVESPANTFTISTDTAQLVTPYDLSLVDQSSANEIQVIDTFQVYDTNKLRISLSQDGQPAKVVTLPAGGGIDSTVVAAGWGIDVAESPLNTFTVKTDTAEVATQYDLTFKQDKLVSGTNIKTVNSNSLLGSGNVSVGTITSIATSAPVSGGTITTTGTIGLNYDPTYMGLDGSNRLYPLYNVATWNANELRGKSIAVPFNPTTGQVLTYNGSAWTASTPSSTATNLTFTGSSSPFTLNSDTGTDVTIAAGTGISLTRSTNELTIASTLTSPQTWGDFTTNIQSWGSTGSFGSGKDVGIGGQPTRDFDVIGDARLRGAIYNSSNSAGSSGQVLTSNGTSAWSWATPADGSATNEIQNISTNGTAGNISISSGSTLTLNVNDADASTTNELQTLSHTSNSTTHTVTLSNSGGSLILTEGDGIGLSTSSNNVTIVNTIQRGASELSRTSDLNNPSVGTTPVKMDFNTGTQINNGKTSFNTSTDRITILSTVVASSIVRISYSGYFETDQPQHVIFQVYKNGSALSYEGITKVTPDDSDYSEPSTYSKSFFHQVQPDDYFELYYYSPSGSTANIDFKSVSFNIEILN